MRKDSKRFHGLTISEIRAIKRQAGFIEAEENYFLGFKFFENLDAKSSYHRFKLTIEKEGSISIFITAEKKVKVFTPELAYILTSKKISVTPFCKNEKLIINGSNYIDPFYDAYVQGINFFKSIYSISPDNIYSQHGERYIKELHEKCFHEQTEGQFGWYWIKRQYPLTISNLMAKKYGYYSGIVSQVDELKKYYSKMFEAYDKCNRKNSLTQKHENYIKSMLENLKIEVGKKSLLYLCASLLNEKHNNFSCSTIKEIKTSIGKITRIDLSNTTEFTRTIEKKYMPIIKEYIRNNNFL